MKLATLAKAVLAASALMSASAFAADAPVTVTKPILKLLPDEEILTHLI